MSSPAFRSAAAATLLSMSMAAPLAANAAEAMRVVRDPQTGELRGPTAAEADAFKKAEEQMRAARTGKSAVQAAPAQEITYPDGTVEMPLGEDSMLSSVATIGKDGSLRMHCLPARQAQSLVRSTARKHSGVGKTQAKVDQ